MKRISLHLFFILAILPQASFGANLTSSQTAAFTQKQNAEIIAFNQQQVLERDAFYQSNQSIVTKLGQRISLTPQEQAVMTAFLQNQQAHKMAFYQQLAVEREAFLSSPL